MKIEIQLKNRDVAEIVAEHCKKNFNIDVHNVDIKLAGPGGENIYFVKVEGDYELTL